MRSEVGVGAVYSNCECPHEVKGRQIVSDVVVAENFWYCIEVHCVAHTRSEVAVGDASSCSITAHVFTVAHCLSEVLVGAAISK